MAKLKDLPENLRPYVFHGVNLEYRPNDENAIGDCPWCGRQGKFSVRIETGQWRCFVCNEGDGNKAFKGGNSTTFVRMLWKMADEETSDYGELQYSRKMNNADTLIHWGVAKSPLNGMWVAPGYDAEGKLRTLYQYRQILVDGKPKYRLLPTPTLGHHLHGVNLYDKNKPTVFLCEGLWDGMKLWEILQCTKQGSKSLTQTASRDQSLLSEANVLATPGANAFIEAWLKLFSDKDVILMFDNDHPRVHPKTGKPVPAAGYLHTQRITGILSDANPPPRSIQFLQWGGPGKEYAKELPSGYDVRDFITQ